MAERLTELTPDDRARAEAVLVTHSRFIEAVAVRYAPHVDAVPDIVQEVGIRVCQSLHTFRGDANIKTWLYRITQNTAVSAYRAQAKHDRTAERLAQQPDEIVEIEDIVIEGQIADERGLLVRRILRGPQLRHADGSAVLTPRQREALRHFRQPGRVRLLEGDKSALFRARARIKLWIQTHRPELTDECDE